MWRVLLCTCVQSSHMAARSPAPSWSSKTGFGSGFRRCSWSRFRRRCLQTSFHRPQRQSPDLHGRAWRSRGTAPARHPSCERLPGLAGRLARAVLGTRPGSSCRSKRSAGSPSMLRLRAIAAQLSASGAAASPVDRALQLARDAVRELEVASGRKVSSR